MNDLQEIHENKSSKQAEISKNGYVLQPCQTSRTELMNQMRDVPDDILCGPIETTEKHSHTSRKHKKFKRHKLDENADGSNGIHIQPNALATEDITVVDSSENLSTGKLIPKIILSRNSEDFNKFMVKETSTNSDNSLKRRRSTDDSGKKLHDNKRAKSVQEEKPVLMIPSIPIKLDRRLSSTKLEDAYGEY